MPVLFSQSPRADERVAQAHAEIDVLRWSKEISALDYLMARAIIAGQYGVVTWRAYVDSLISTRGRTDKTPQKRLE